MLILNEFKSLLDISTYDQDLNCNMVHIALKAQTSNYWYFARGYSRHITSNKFFFTKLTSTNDGFVTFSDDNNALIYGRGSISDPSIPKLKDVHYVERTKANLISIRKICDNKCIIKFTQIDCIMYDELGTNFVKCIQSKDNCYI